MRPREEILKEVGQAVETNDSGQIISLAFEVLLNISDQLSTAVKRLDSIERRIPDPRPELKL